MVETMTAPQMSDGQIENLTDKLRAALRKHRHEFPTDVSQHICGVKNIGEEFVDKVVRKHAEAKMLLVPQGTVTITLEEDHDPDRDFCTRSGLWVSDDFRSRIVANARKSLKGVNIKVSSAKLTQDATDEKIEAGLPAGHLFDETTMCAVIANLIAKQENGKEGVLLNNSYANLFYTSSCVVDVRWDADGRRWHVFTWLRDDNRWDTGVQVFSPATGN